MRQSTQTPKNQASTNTRQRDLAKIHIGKKQLGIDDQTYRDMLFDIAGVESAADLDGRGRDAVIKHLIRRGFKPAPKKPQGYKSTHKSAKASGMHTQSSPERAPLLSKIGAILADLDLSWPYADGIAKRMFGIDKVRWLNPVQLRKVVAALVYRQKKLKADAHNEKNRS